MDDPPSAGASRCGVIDFVYQRTERALPGYVGLENDTGMLSVQPNPGLTTPMAGRHYRFTPIP